MLKFRTISAVTLLLVLLVLVLAYIGTFPIWPVILIFFIWFVITSLGSAFIGWRYHVNAVLSSKPSDNNKIAITFDDGPNQEFTPQVLKLLKRYNAKATFFCIGMHIYENQELLCEIVADGHTIGNHTYSHSNFFGFFPTKKVQHELADTNALVYSITGKELLLYRPAFGVTNPNIAKAIKRLKMIAVGWSKRSLDTTKLSEDEIFNRITTKLESGDIILLHDTSQKTIHVLERLLLFMEQHNLESVTVDSLCNIKAYA